MKEKKMEEYVVGHIYANDYSPDQSWQLLQWCRRHGTEEWTLSAKPGKKDRSRSFDYFQDTTEQFRLPLSERRQLTMSRRQAFVRPTPLWRLNSAAFVALQQFLPDGLFSYAAKRDGEFEDPVFYRSGELMLGIVSHEKEGVIRVTSEECRSLRAQGFVIRDFGTLVGY
jgi:hypothetical protein